VSGEFSALNVHMVDNFSNYSDFHAVPDKQTVTTFHLFSNRVNRLAEVLRIFNPDATLLYDTHTAHCKAAYEQASRAEGAGFYKGFTFSRWTIPTDPAGLYNSYIINIMAFTVFLALTGVGSSPTGATLLYLFSLCAL